MRVLTTVDGNWHLSIIIDSNSSDHVVECSDNNDSNFFLQTTIPLASCHFKKCDSMLIWAMTGHKAYGIHNRYQVMTANHQVMKQLSGKSIIL